MTPVPPHIQTIGIACGFALAALGLSLLALVRARAILRRAETAAAPPSAPAEAAIGILQQAVEELREQVEELRRHPAPAPALAARHALNLDKRSQALRMHRRGESPEQIAAVLEIPLQQVDLLLKVHRIVLSNI